MSIAVFAAAKHFNPRSRVGSDDCKFMELSILIISIHAPAWGATKARADINTALEISIHAPAWGATPRVLISLISVKFQSTLPRGERRERENFCVCI